LKLLNLCEGDDGRVTLPFIDGGKSSRRKFIVQDCTSKGEEFKSDIRFGLKTPVESVGEESPLEEISNMAFDGGDERRGSESTSPCSCRLSRTNGAISNTPNS
jgi:hypothetical protein